ncbi:GNAT family N-acetyltransferase [Deinococcus yavapaiensis]|uniref:Acetyltransferase (GNAT) family protein n=1 Tax=Deinococcus yavapaiensis KR-236 TaxID=694435 RepID=A0A318SGY5_9DEIO|nr:GNAT family N-acetyltransferase [Deinococcus yavapaiensis]PYE56365.1 acetyltransferase (GNAT) family protein [Deinococcus yavapaiensis KR-236]
MTSLHVLRADPSHLDLLAPLFDGYRQFYGQASDLGGARAFLAERLENKESVIFLALDERVPLGFTQLYPSFTSVGMRRIWILNDLFVAPLGRRRGVGQALLQRARQHAAETGVARLTLSTAVDNLGAQALYEANGWTRDEGFYTYNLPL